MKEDKKITGDRIYLRSLSSSDVSDEYKNWMNCSDVVQFTESRWVKHSLGSLKEYIGKANRDPRELLFGIFLKDTGRHIGNIKIGAIDMRHRIGDVGILIGDRKMWGRGYGTEAIALITGHGFKKMRLNKLKAGVYANNVGSYKAFIKASYAVAGRLKKSRIYKGRFVDEILLEKNHDDKR